MKTKTDASGKFSFSYLVDGDYFVHILIWDSQYDIGTSSDNKIEIRAQREAGSGMATGRRTHKQLVITKELDKSTTKLMEKSHSGTSSSTMSDIDASDESLSQTSNTEYNLKENVKRSASNGKKNYCHVAFAGNTISGGIIYDDSWTIQK